MGLFTIFKIAGSGMVAQSLRLNTTASNLANANSVASSPSAAYRAREPLFSAVRESALDSGESVTDSTTDSAGAVGVKVDGITESSAPVTHRYEPGNPMADAKGYVYGSDVSPIDALVNMISASRSYQDDVEIIDSAKQLALKTLSLGE